MRTPIRGVSGLLVLSLLVTACGTDTAETDDPLTSTDPSVTTTAPPTTESPATTAAPTTTRDLDHPLYGVPWSDMAPPDDGATAEYELTNLGEVFRFPATYETGVEFGGGVWDRLTIGEPGDRYHTMYFDSPEPWVIRYGGWEIFFADGSKIVDRQPEPLVLDLRGESAEIMSLDAESVLVTSTGEQTMGMHIELELVEAGEMITVPAGTFETAHIRVTLGGEMFEGHDADVHVWLGAGMWFVRITAGPAWENMELAEAWS